MKQLLLAVALLVICTGRDILVSAIPAQPVKLLKLLVMKPLLTLVLLVMLAACSKPEAQDVAPATPTPSQQQLLEGSWRLIRQAYTTASGQTSVSELPNSDYYILLTATEYIGYSGTVQNYRYPYTLTNGLLRVTGGSFGTNDYTIRTLTATALALDYSVN